MSIHYIVYIHRHYIGRRKKNTLDLFYAIQYGPMYYIGSVTSDADQGQHIQVPLAKNDYFDTYSNVGAFWSTPLKHF